MVPQVCHVHEAPEGPRGLGTFFFASERGSADLFGSRSDKLIARRNSCLARAFLQVIASHCGQDREGTEGKSSQHWTTNESQISSEEVEPFSCFFHAIGWESFQF